MKKIHLILNVVFVLLLCNIVMAYTVELDPLTPLDNYVSIGEWNTDDDFEDWTTFQTADPAVYGGSVTGRVIGNDMNISLNISSLPEPDVRVANVFTTGSVYEVRLRFDPFTENQRIDYFPTMDGIFKVPPMHFANNGIPELPDIPNDGLFHVYRLTFDASDTFYLGRLDSIRFDILADWNVSNETFEVDYFRIANVITNVPFVNPITVDGTPLPFYTDLAEWNTDGDFEDWIFSGIGSSNVSGGIMSGTPSNGDPWFYKSDVQGLPQPSLDEVPIIEFRIKQLSSFTSEMEVFFGTSDNPGASGSRRVIIPQSEIPVDGNFHVYQYDMSGLPDWSSELQLMRIDPYVTDSAIGKLFEIDYIRVGSFDTPTINPSASQGTYADKVVVNWDEVDGVNKYQVWRNTTNDDSTAAINSPELTTNIFEDTTAVSDVYYYYWVKAFITNEWGDFGNSAFGFATTSTGPYTPVNVSPADGALIPSFPVVLEASAYSDEYGWPMEAVQWQFDSDTNFSHVKWDSGVLLTNLTTIEPPSSIIGTQNYWRVRYRNDRTKWSEWSSPTMFEFNVIPVTNSPYYFYDTFNVTGSGDVNENFYVAGRQFGLATPLNYTIEGNTEIGSDSSNPGELMIGLSSGVSPNYSFTGSGNFKLEFDVIPHNLEATNDWVGLTFGKSNQSSLFPVSPSGAGMVFFGNHNFQAFDGETLVGGGAGVPSGVPLHIVLTASTEAFDNDPVQYSAFANGVPMIVDTTPNPAYIYDDIGGYDANYISLYSYNIPDGPTNSSLFDNLKITEVENTVNVTNWLSDSDMLPMNPAKTTHAVNINGESVTINGVNFIGTGTNFGGHANGSAILQSNGWELMSSGGTVTFHNDETVTNIVTDSGTKTLMEYFGYFNNAAGLRLSGLTPFSSNVISIYSYGWGNPGAGRFLYFSSTSGGSITNVDQDTYGLGSGIIVRYGYVADGNGECTIVISPVISAGWHLSGFYSEEIAEVPATISVADKLDFGEVVAGIPTTLQLEVMNMGAGVVSGSISGIVAPFSMADSYFAISAASDIINVTFNPSGEEIYSETITLSGSGGDAQVELTGTGVPEPGILWIVGLLELWIIGKHRKRLTS